MVLYDVSKECTSKLSRFKNRPKSFTQDKEVADVYLRGNTIVDAVARIISLHVLIILIRHISSYKHICSAKEEREERH